MENRRYPGPSGIPVPNFALETPQPQSRLGRMRQSLGASAFPDKSFNLNTPQAPLLQSALRSNQSIRRQSTRPAASQNSQLPIAQTPGLASRTINRGPGFPIANVVPRSGLPRMQYLPDDRSLREKASQSLMLKSVNEFMREQGKDMVLRFHPTPSAKEFQDAFLFIYNVVFEEDHVLGAKRMDEEVIELLRVVRYPWVDTLTKLSFTVITPHVWPQLIGTLHWMVGIYKFDDPFMKEAKDQNLIDDPNLEEFSGNPTEDQPLLSRLFLSYLQDVWLDYLCGKENFDVQKSEFMDVLNFRMENLAKAAEQQDKEVIQLQEELKLLRGSENEAEKLKAELAEINLKIDHAQEVIRSAQTKIQSQLHGNQLMDDDIRGITEKLADMTQRNASLVENIRVQNISEADVKKMHRDRQELNKQIDDLKKKDNDLSNTGNHLAITVFNMLEKVESLVESINGTMYEIGLLPKPPPPFIAEELQINFNRATDNLDELIADVDTSHNGTLVRKLLTYAANMRKEKVELASQAVMLENDHELVQSDVDQLMEEMELAIKETNNRLEALNNLRTVWEEEARRSRAYLETMVKDIAKIKASNQERGLELSLRLQTLELSKMETVAKIQRLKSRLSKDLVAKLEEAEELQRWIQTHLETLTKKAKEDDLEVLERTPDNLDNLLKKLSLD
ncbi:kinetochore-associated Ndc80 complex subunit ndc80 [Serendipita sp. 396]|nr:kinetochore-associated Ndc80 complex subunit ndc80 [Serendipita sp. 396]KAG8796684.1 kinetochore-associated Ndc80 complex subunit ndc80 [Serendipita sp. 398]KAG8866318.1 kinetochore-associated Ndc80 complex subunit ndc80 [Serendipita sp. 405]KAG9054384.1 kinetochore-associated Ndc80 complex subunit ndc80 [Serendipita sp. 407]